MDGMNLCVVEIVQKYKGQTGELLAILQDIQLVFGHLPQQALQIVADKTGRTLADVYAFATFGDTFRFEQSTMPATSNRGHKLSNTRDVVCPQCRHTLLDQAYLIDNQPAVRITVSFDLFHGWLRLSSAPRSTAYVCEYELPDHGQVNYFCPHCHAELARAENCGMCLAPLILKLEKTGFSLRCLREHDQHQTSGLAVG